MIAAFHATKLVVADLALAEAFYIAIGMTPVSRNIGGEAEVRQSQTWLSATGAPGEHVLIVSQFLELAAPPSAGYPGEAWLALMVDDVDAVAEAAQAAGDALVRAGEDRPEHSVRAGLVSDPDGHVIELVGPMQPRDKT